MKKRKTSSVSSTGSKKSPRNKVFERLSKPKATVSPQVKKSPRQSLPARKPLTTNSQVIEVSSDMQMRASLAIGMDSGRPSLLGE